ncbi:unnamed protein product [Pedinophyceae sp. YPF-701]|nr:unnamed protein product [Pedinophyceae sp. YPF-701]
MAETKKQDFTKKYLEDLDPQAGIQTEVNDSPKAEVHRTEWKKVMEGLPVEINPSVGDGYKIMSVEEWSKLWKRNDDLAECANCGSTRTKEHHFMQTWCKLRKMWEAESLCLDCHSFTWRSYKDPDFQWPEDIEKAYWTREYQAYKQEASR